MCIWDVAVKPVGMIRLIWYVIDAGVKLAELYNSLTGYKLQVKKKHLKHVATRRAKIKSVLDKFEQDAEMNLDSHNADDFLDCDRKLVLSFIWQVIKRFDQSASGVSREPGYGRKWSRWSLRRMSIG